MTAELGESRMLIHNPHILALSRFLVYEGAGSSGGGGGGDDDVWDWVRSSEEEKKNFD